MYSSASREQINVFHFIKKYSLLFLCFIAFMATGNAQQVPSFKQVVTEFYTRYSFEDYEKYLRFQKRKDGWFVAQDYYNDPGKYFNERLFWSAKDASYLDINYHSSTDDTSSVASRVASYLKTIDWAFEEYQFERNKYYGYPGWDWDMINDPRKQNEITDTLWESMARAYSNYASGFIVEQYGDLFQNNDADRMPLKPTDSISLSRRDKFIFYETKAIEAYKNILNQNPFYQTRVGSIQIKLANEYMFVYSDLVMAADSIRAKEFAMQAVYPDSLLTRSRAYLDSLPLHSLLVTGGDNDTYPIWYLQETKKFRKDVLVLNYSLLGLRKYLYIHDKITKGTLFKTKDSIYLKNNFEYFLYSNGSKNFQAIDATEFITNLNKNKNPFDSAKTYYKEEILKKYYSKKLYFSPKLPVNIPGKKRVHSGIIALNDYLLINDFIMLDIINTNMNKRSVYSTFDIQLLSPILVFNGVTYKVKLVNN